MYEYISVSPFSCWSYIVFRFGSPGQQVKLSDFSCLLATWFFLFCKWPLQASAHFLLAYLPFCYWFERVLYIPDTRFFVSYMYHKRFPPVYSCPFHFRYGMFGIDVLNLNVVKLINLYVSCFFVYLKKSLSTPRPFCNLCHHM